MSSWERTSAGYPRGLLSQQELSGDGPYCSQAECRGLRRAGFSPLWRPGSPEDQVDKGFPVLPYCRKRAFEAGTVFI